MKLNRIIVATDGSAPAARATDVALDLAAGQEAEVIAVHVTRDVPWDEDIQDLPLDEYQQSLIKDDPVLAEVDRIARDQGVRTQVRRVVGHGAREIADTIVGIASGADADLIVVGARGLGGIAAMMGSVSEAVVRAARTPVLVIHGDSNGTPA